LVCGRLVHFDAGCSGRLVFVFSGNRSSLARVEALIMIRWLLAALGWLAPNVLLVGGLSSIPAPGPGSHPPAGDVTDWLAGWVVIPGFMVLFFLAGLVSIRLALRLAPEYGRTALARVGMWGSGAWLALCVSVCLSQTNDPQLVMGMSCLVLWGLGHALGSRWKSRPVDRG